MVSFYRVGGQHNAYMTLDKATPTYRCQEGTRQGTGGGSGGSSGGCRWVGILYKVGGTAATTIPSALEGMKGDGR